MPHVQPSSLSSLSAGAFVRVVMHAMVAVAALWWPALVQAQLQPTIDRIRPSWMREPPLSSRDTLVGVGSGYSTEEALLSALVAAAEQLSAQVSTSREGGRRVETVRAAMQLGPCSIHLVRRTLPALDTMPRIVDERRTLECEMGSPWRVEARYLTDDRRGQETTLTSSATDRLAPFQYLFLVLLGEGSQWSAWTAPSEPQLLQGVLVRIPADRVAVISSNP